MSPLGLVVAGFALVVLDLRVDGFDLASDVLGWIVAGFGLWPLLQRSQWFGIAAAAAVVGVLLAVPAQLAEPGWELQMITGVVETGLVFSVCSGVAEAARSLSGIRATAVRIRWLDLGVLLVTVVLLATGPPGPAVLIVLVLFTLGVAAWFMIFLLSVRDQPTLQAGTGTVKSPR